jgi:hypothetical protein
MAITELDKPTPFWQRLAWMIGIWAASIFALALCAEAIRLWLGS